MCRGGGGGGGRQKDVREARLYRYPLSVVNPNIFMAMFRREAVGADQVVRLSVACAHQALVS